MAQENAANPRTRVPFRLGSVEVRPASNELVVGGATRRIKPRLMDVLLRLAAAPGEVVTRETLLADAWPRRMVNDEVLSRAIADLRDALGDDAREARYIETLPKVGYRLIAPVTPVAASAASPTAAVVPPVAAPSVAASNVAAPPVAASSVAATRIPRARIALAAVAAVALTALLVQRCALPPAIVSAAELTRQLASAAPFASDEQLELAPRFAPDGSRVAFALGDAGSARIVVRDVGGTASVTLGDPAFLNLAPVFFPDGGRIAYFRRNAQGACAIVAHDLQTGSEALLVDCTRRPQPRFDLSPDGRYVVFTGVVREQFPSGLILRDIASGEERVLTAPPPDQGDDRYPRFAPDGTRLVFFRGTESHREAMLIATAANAAATSLGSPRGLSYGAAWLGNDGPLLIAADWFGQRSLNLLDLRTQRAVGVGARGARFPDVARSGDIVFENAVFRADLYELDPRAPARAPVVRWPSTRYTNQAEYSPDGTRVLFVSNRDGEGALYVAARDGTPQRVLPADGYSYLRPHWSEDGRAVYAIRAQSGEDGTRRQQAVRIALPEGRLEVLENLGIDVTEVRELPGGTHLLAGEAAGNATRLSRVPRAGGAGERLPLPLVAEVAVAGGRLAFTQPELAGLTLCDTQARACEALPLPIDERNRFDWVLTHDAVWYAAGEPRMLVRYDLARQEVVATYAFAPTALGLSIAVAPDGNAVLVAREAPVAIDLLLARQR